MTRRKVLCQGAQSITHPGRAPTVFGVVAVGLLLARPDSGLTQQAGVDPAPADARAWIDDARDWRSEGEPDSALAALRRAAEFGEVSPGLIALEFARTAFLAGYPTDGLEAYRDGCEQADAETLDEYWRDFAAVATIDEQSAWRAAMELDGAARTDAACALLQAGWGERASRSGLGVAERLSLHYERLRYARERYSLMGEGTRLGPRTRLLSNQVGRPEGADLDDRGLVYVRLGEPDRVASFGGSGAVTRKLPSGADPRNAPVRAIIRDLVISAECYHPNESWAYDFPSGMRTFHFSPLEGTADWWLLENLLDVYRCGDPTNVVSMVPDDLDEAMTAVLTPAAGTRHAPPSQIAWLVMSDLYISRVGMDPSYGPIAHRIHASGPNSVADLDGLRRVHGPADDHRRRGPREPAPGNLVEGAMRLDRRRAARVPMLGLRIGGMMALPALHQCERPRRPRRTGVLLLIGCLSAGAPALAQERVDPVPDAPEPIVEALSPFAGNPDSSRVASLLAEASANDFPASDYDGVLVARLWRRAGVTELAMESLEAIPVDSDAVDLALYEAARTFIESGRDAAGARAYWSACGSSDPRVRAEIALDLLPVTVPDEREAWPDVVPGEPTCEWLRSFWAERARGMIVPVDQRIATHFRRLATARREYYLKKPRIEADMASDHGRPSGLAVDDRGLLYIRMGEPEDRQACPEEYPVPPDTLFRENRFGVCWIYERPPYYRLYYLTTKDRFGWNLPDNDYRIQENFSHQAEPGTLLFQKYVVNSDISRSTRAGLIARGPVSRLRRLVKFDSGFQTPSGGMAEALRPLLPDAADEAEYRRYEQEMKLATRRYTAAALEQIPDAPVLRATLDLRFEVLRFLNPSQAVWQVWMLGAVPAGQLARTGDTDETQTLEVSGRFSVTTDDGMQIGPVTSRSIRARSVPPEAGILVSGATSTRPGALPFTFLVEDVNAPGTGIWLQDTVNVPAVGGLPQLSDIAVAQAEGGNWTRDGQTFLQVTPAHITNPDGSIHTYFEVYGVRPGTPYDVEFRLAPLDAAERIWRLEPDDLAFRLQFTSEMPGDIGRHHLRLDLDDTEPGEYVLAVRIQDDETKAYSLPSVTDVVVVER